MTALQLSVAKEVPANVDHQPAVGHLRRIVNLGVGNDVAEAADELIERLNAVEHAGRRAPFDLQAVRRERKPIRLRAQLIVNGQRGRLCFFRAFAPLLPSFDYVGQCGTLESQLVGVFHGF